MRWVFYSLVVVNLVYLGWQMLVRTMEPPPAVAAQEVRESEPAEASLRLLSEAPQPARRQRASAPGRPGLCPVVGPWADRNRAERGRIQLDAAGLEARVKAITVHKDHLNWVYLPPFDSRGEALDVLGELQSLGVDSFVVNTGEDANAISLGYFSSRESAEGLRVKMRNAGYPAFTRETSRPVTEYWLYMPRQAVDAPELEDFMVGNPEVRRERVACPDRSAGS